MFASGIFALNGTPFGDMHNIHYLSRGNELLTCANELLRRGNELSGYVACGDDLVSEETVSELLFLH